MSDNLKIIEQTVESVLNENGAPGSILALDHKNFVKDLLRKSGKYTGTYFVAHKTLTNFISGTMSWESKAMNTTTNFVIKTSKLTADLNDFGEVLSRIGEGTLMSFKDYVGRRVYLIFKSYISSVDGSSNPIYEITVSGLAQNINYTYQTNEFEICGFEIVSSVSPENYLGLYPSIENLNIAHPSALPGNFADVDGGIGQNVQRYIWDNDDDVWVLNSGIPFEFLSDFVDDIGATEREIIKVTDKSQLIDQDLDETKVYYLLKSISLTATERIRVNNLKLLYGLGHDIVTISTTEANSLIFESTGLGCSDVKIYALSLSAGGTDSQAFNIKDVDGSHEVRFKGINFNGCSNIGVFDGFRQGFMDDIGFYGCANGFELKGDWNGFKLFNSNIFSFGSSGVLIKNGTGLLFSNRMFLSINFDFPIGAILTDMVESNFSLNELFQVNSTIAKRNGVLDISNASLLIPNISANSVKSLWIGNIGLPDTATEVFVEDLTVSGTYNIDWLKDTYYLTMTGDTTFSELNIPASGKNTQEIKVYLTGNFVPTFPAGWNVNKVGTYKGTDVNEISIKFIKTGLYFVKIANSLTQYPAPILGSVIPISLLPGSTSELRLKGSFFTPEGFVLIDGQIVNTIEFDSDTGDYVLSVTTGLTEDEFDVTISNGTSVTFSNKLIVNLGDVFIPSELDWTTLLGNPNLTEDGSVKISSYNSATSVRWNKEFDYTKDFIVRFRAKASVLGTPLNQNIIAFVVSLQKASNNDREWELMIRDQSNTVANRTKTTSDVDTSSTDLLGSQRTDYWAGLINIEVRHISGVLYFYVNGVLGRTYTKTLTENVRLSMQNSKYDFVQIKYIEIP